MKNRFALASTAFALLGAAALGAFSTAAEAQAVSGAVSGGYYQPAPAYGPPPAYYYPPAPAYYYPPPAYYYPPAPAYYYPPPPVYYERPSYLLPGISANFVFGFGGGGHGHNHWRRH